LYKPKNCQLRFVHGDQDPELVRRLAPELEKVLFEEAWRGAVLVDEGEQAVVVVRRQLGQARAGRLSVQREGLLEERAVAVAPHQEEFDLVAAARCGRHEQQAESVHGRRRERHHGHEALDALAVRVVAPLAGRHHVQQVVAVQRQFVLLVEQPQEVAAAPVGARLGERAILLPRAQVTHHLDQIVQVQRLHAPRQNHTGTQEALQEEADVYLHILLILQQIGLKVGSHCLILKLNVQNLPSH